MTYVPEAVISPITPLPPELEGTKATNAYTLATYQHIPDGLVMNNTPEQFWIPTETIVYKPGFQVPQVGRYYRVYDWEFHKESYAAVSRKAVHELMARMQARPDQLEINNCFERLYMVEIYLNRGDDGHIEYELYAYGLVRESRLPLFTFEYRDSTSSWKRHKALCDQFDKEDAEKGKIVR